MPYLNSFRKPLFILLLLILAISLTPAALQNANAGNTHGAAIATNNSDALALKSDGTVWAWGHIFFFGYAYNSSVTPVQLNGLSSIIAITAGLGHTVVLKSDGTVWAWGHNYHGELGDGITTNHGRSTPAQVSGIGSVSAITAGLDDTIALKSDGTVWAWGYNGHGQLGDGTNVDRYTPVQVSGIGSVSAISTSDAHTVALKSDGTVWAWSAPSLRVMLTPWPSRVTAPSGLGEITSMANWATAPTSTDTPRFRSAA